MKSKLRHYLFLLFLTYLLLEAGTCVLMKANVLPGDIPTFMPSHVGSRFWKDINPDFGVWHVANTTFRHRKSCFDVEYRTNGEGMRDRPRSRAGSGDRVLMIGDSFIEGWGVPEADRLSNRFESEKGREFLNFGTSGYFGPTQYYLLYDRLAKFFSHSEIVVGLLPSNDFNDDDYELWKNKGRHRPFWVGTYPNYELKYSEAVDEGVTFTRYFGGVLREFSYLYNAIKNLVLSYRLGNQASEGPIFSRFYDFSEAEGQRVLFSLEKLRASAQGKKLTVLLIPTLNDLRRYEKSGKSPLTLLLEKWADQSGSRLLDLTPWFHEYPRDKSEFYFSCDNHWNSFGNQVAFEYLKDLL